jgi:hypothetical protein
MAIKTYECRIARRGKAAKGTVLVTTFGKPVIAKDAKPTDPVKFWDYSELAKVDQDVAIKATTESTGLTASELLFRAADIVNKSEGIKGQGQTVLLTARIFNEGLATDVTEAKKLAALWVSIRSQNAAVGLPVPEIDDLLKLRKKFVADLKAKGQWVIADKKESALPRLVDNRPKEEESDEEEVDEEESEEDTDEEESTE